ncbi:hypothetical protein BS17DRAFT_34891 [Gyrodon lividus]|nr:hypothetical protein BS17DRAFT_34891 [Gyrodon lividus]
MEGLIWISWVADPRDRHRNRQYRRGPCFFRRHSRRPNLSCIRADHPAQLNDVAQRLEGCSGKAHLEVEHNIPSDVPDAQLWECLQKHFGEGAGSTG